MRIVVISIILALGSITSLVIINNYNRPTLTEDLDSTEEARDAEGLVIAFLEKQRDQEFEGAKEYLGPTLKGENNPAWFIGDGQKKVEDYAIIRTVYQEDEKAWKVEVGISYVNPRKEVSRTTNIYSVRRGEYKNEIIRIDIGRNIGYSK